MLSRTIFAAAVLLVSSLLPASEETVPLQKQNEELVGLLRQYKPNRDLRPEASLLEPSKVLLLPHVFQGHGNSETGRQDQLAIEVEFNETFFPYQNLPTATDRHFGGLTTKFGITPMYRVRIWREQSAPVRVPSFMPKGTIYWEWLSHRERGQQWGSRHGETKPITVHSAMLTIGHHSNGQDGCLFADASGVGFTPDRDGLCPTPAADSIRINRLNGSFSTNYAEVSYYLRRLSLAPSDSRYDIHAAVPALWKHERRAKHSWLVGGTYQWNFPFNSFGGALERPARPIYGMNRLRIAVGYDKYWVESGKQVSGTGPRLWQRFKENGLKTRAWVEISDKAHDSADCVPSGPRTQALPPCAPRTGWGVDFTFGLFSKADGLGLYTRYFQGQDYYNLSFPQRKDNRFQIGLSFSLSRLRGPAFPVVDDEVLENEPKTEPEWKKFRGDVKRQFRQSSKVNVAH